jgi:hypothetical protein
MISGFPRVGLDQRVKKGFALDPLLKNRKTLLIITERLRDTKSPALKSAAADFRQ